VVGRAGPVSALSGNCSVGGPFEIHGASNNETLSANVQRIRRCLERGHLIEAAQRFFPLIAVRLAVIADVNMASSPLRSRAAQTDGIWRADRGDDDRTGLATGPVAAVSEDDRVRRPTGAVVGWSGDAQRSVVLEQAASHRSRAEVPNDPHVLLPSRKLEHTRRQ
jgi:hypothetical protein